MSDGEIVKLKQTQIDTFIMMHVVGGMWGWWHESAIKTSMLNDMDEVWVMLLDTSHRSSSHVLMRPRLGRQAMFRYRV